MSNTNNTAANTDTTNTATLAPVELGREVEVGTIRIHRWSDQISITDLTNAGKRGKKVEEVWVSVGPAASAGEQVRLDMLSKSLQKHPTFVRVLDALDGIEKIVPGAHKVHKCTLRGVDVTPAGEMKLRLSGASPLGGGSFRLEASGSEWRLVTTYPCGPGGAYGHDTTYCQARGKPQAKKESKIVRAWMVANLAKISKMSPGDARSAISDLGVVMD